jgi:hypothetical protein
MVYKDGVASTIHDVNLLYLKKEVDILAVATRQEDLEFRSGKAAVDEVGPHLGKLLAFVFFSIMLGST